MSWKCESCNYRSVQMLVTFDDGEVFRVCMSCAQEADYGREVSVRDAIRNLRVGDARAATA